MKGKYFFFLRKKLIISICILGYPLIPDFFLDVDPDTIAMKMEAQGKETTLSLSLANPGLKKEKWEAGACALPHHFHSSPDQFWKEFWNYAKHVKSARLGRMDRFYQDFGYWTDTFGYKPMAGFTNHNKP